jgi:hypothetical protein
MNSLPSLVIPAEAGIQAARSAVLFSYVKHKNWIPAFAGMTV